MNNRWYTPKDVLNDLAEVTGIRGSDEGFILRGQRPPPPRCLDDEDDEIQLRYGGTGNLVAPYDPVTPDLPGITNMLRMVDKFQQKEDFIIREDNCQPSTVIVISKLNPEVKEFIPGGAENSCSSTSTSIIQAKIYENPNNDKVIKEKAKTEASLEEKTRNTFNSKELVEKLKMEALLKETIKGTANASTMKQKRDRNVALMHLMQLNCKPPTPSHTLAKANSSLHSSGSNSPKPILIPPEYFENAPCSANDGKQSTSSESKITSGYISLDITSNTDIGSSSKTNISANVSPKVTSESSLEVRVGNVDKVMDPDMKSSIEKVNRWLDVEKQKENKPLAPHLGTIVYRKKEHIKKESTPETSKPSKNVTPAFVPSQRASELAKTYEERSKAKPEASQDMWSKLENDLRAKDEEIKKRQNADENASPSGRNGRFSSRRKRHI